MLESQVKWRVVIADGPSKLGQAIAELVALTSDGFGSKILLENSVYICLRRCTDGMVRLLLRTSHVPRYLAQDQFHIVLEADKLLVWTLF